MFGVDFTQPWQPEVIAEVKAAFLQHLVLFFREQKAADEDLARFARNFGELAVLRPHRRSDGLFPELLIIDKKPEDNLVFGWEWHSDTSHLPVPPMGSVLCAWQLPPYGGDTMFANQYMAYDTPSQGMMDLLGHLKAVHSNGRILSTFEADDVLEPGQGWGRTHTNHEMISSVHPVVRTHPETGRKAPYVNTLHTERFENMTISESTPLLRYLFDHAVKPEFACRLRWQPGTIAFRDNRCSQHLALDDYPGQRRIMHRVQVRGTVPV